jgi:hypothetical protein
LAGGLEPAPAAAFRGSAAAPEESTPTALAVGAGDVTVAAPPEAGGVPIAGVAPSTSRIEETKPDGPAARIQGAGSSGSAALGSAIASRTTAEAVGSTKLAAAPCKGTWVASMHRSAPVMGRMRIPRSYRSITSSESKHASQEVRLSAHAKIPQHEHDHDNHANDVKDAHLPAPSCTQCPAMLNDVDPGKCLLHPGRRSARPSLAGQPYRHRTIETQSSQPIAGVSPINKPGLSSCPCSRCPGGTDPYP